MPSSSSAKKSQRQNETRRLRNRRRRSALRTYIRKFEKAAESGDRDAAEAAFRTAVKQIDKAASKGLLHANTAARQKSRLSKLLPRRVPAPAGSGESGGED